MEIPTNDQKGVISECWSRGYDYDQYVEHSNKLSAPVVREPVYNYHYNIQSRKYHAWIKKQIKKQEKDSNPTENCIIRIKNEEDKTDE